MIIVYSSQFIGTGARDCPIRPVKPVYNLNK